MLKSYEIDLTNPCLFFNYVIFLVQNPEKCHSAKSFLNIPIPGDSRKVGLI